MSEHAMPAHHRHLADVVTLVDAKITAKKDRSKPYIGLEHIPSRGSHLLAWGLADSSISTNAVFSKGDVLFGKLRPNLRKCIAAPFDGYCSTDVLVLRARNGVTPGFAVRVFQSEVVGAAAERTSIGTKMPRTSWAHLRNVVVFCPDDREQSKVALVLDTLDTTIHQTKAIVEKLKQIKQGLLHDLLTRGVDANGELRPSYMQAPELYHESPLGWMPKSWANVPLHSLLSEIGQGWSPDCESIPARMGEWGVLKTTAITWSGYNEQENKALPTHFRGRPELEVRDGDILITRAGPASRVGVVSYVDETRSKLMISDKMYRLKTLPSELPKYIALALSSQHVQRAIGRTLSGMADSQTNISQAIVKELQIFRPQPDEQVEIVARCTELEKQIAHEQRKYEKLLWTKKGLMDDLLTGRVRVTPLLAE